MSDERIPFGFKRSDKWPTFRKHFLEKHSACAVCCSKNKLEAHHKIPVHLRPDLELEEANLIPLCESMDHGVNCHLFIGHLSSFFSYNMHVVKDAEDWNIKLTKRP